MVDQITLIIILCALSLLVVLALLLFLAKLVCTLSSPASEEDNNAVYSCQAKNELILKPLETKLTTVVQCKISIFAVPPLKAVLILIFPQMDQRMSGYRAPRRLSKATS